MLSSISGHITGGLLHQQQQHQAVLLLMQMVQILLLLALLYLLLDQKVLHRAGIFHQLQLLLWQVTHLHRQQQQQQQRQRQSCCRGKRSEAGPARLIRLLQQQRQQHWLRGVTQQPLLQLDKLLGQQHWQQSKLLWMRLGL
jgi:predicted acyl esterase